MRANRVVSSSNRWGRVLVLSVFFSALLVAYPLQAKETVLVSLTTNAAPEAGLVAGNDGVLYGTANGGGSIGEGAVFSLTPPAKGQSSWTQTTLYSFQGGTDGTHPQGGLTPDGQGGFYGGTATGGGNPCTAFEQTSCGTVYHLTPPGQGEQNWTEDVIYAFHGQDGEYPVETLTLDPTTGILYGVTLGGGQWSAGEVYSLTPPGQGQTEWTENVLYSFTGGVDGGFPYTYITLGPNGVLYGTTTTGGVNGGNGAVFQLIPPTGGQTTWTETVLYSFNGWGDCDGEFPDAGLVADASGNFYSTTDGGGCDDYGTVFELSPPTGGQASWTEQVLYAFPGGKAGALPANDIIMDANGSIYSATAAGGMANNGVVFKLSPPVSGGGWTEKTLYSFKGAPKDGSYPESGLTAVKTGKTVALFGTTFEGGSNNTGVVYEITGSGFVFP